ncbi:hypothetical protein OIU84_030239 [Salix udensis]|uniref:Uncharacterized protein n=1 Tax=Salix udensis TaxID=889485 RepID=A0AAD6P872_9ROSI|nr:hypothetical protein OIU84_030239 [Salix udensis]
MDCLFYAAPERKAKVFSRSYALRKAVKINTVEATQMIDGVYCNSSSALTIAPTSSVLPSRSAAKFQSHEDSLLHSKYQSFQAVYLLQCRVLRALDRILLV